MLPRAEVFAIPGCAAACSAARSATHADVATFSPRAGHGTPGLLNSATEPASAAGGPGGELVSGPAEVREFDAAAARARARSSQETLRRLARKLRESVALDGAGSEST